MTTIERHGLAISVTTLERTLVDLFDRYDLAGGPGDLFRSLGLVAERHAPLDIEAVVDFARQRGNAAAAGAPGCWLAHESHRLGVTDAALEDLRPLAPRHVRYALGAHRAMDVPQPAGTSFSRPTSSSSTSMTDRRK